MSVADFQHGRTYGRRDARQARTRAARARLAQAAERERDLARGEYRAMPTARAYALGYARGARDGTMARLVLRAENRGD